MSRRHLRFATGFLVELLGLFLLNSHLREIRDGLSEGLGAAAPAALDPLEFRAGEGMEELARAVGRLRVRYAGPFQEGYMARSGQEAYTFRAVPYDGADALGEPVEFFFRDDGYILADGRHFEAADPAGLEELLELFRSCF